MLSGTRAPQCAQMWAPSSPSRPARRSPVTRQTFWTFKRLKQYQYLKNELSGVAQLTRVDQIKLAGLDKFVDIKQRSNQMQTGARLWSQNGPKASAATSMESQPIVPT